MSERIGPRTWWFVGGFILAIGLLLAIALNREPVALDPNTPEGTVQNYLQAISDEDYAGALNFIHPESDQDCTPADLAAATPTTFPATLGETTTQGSSSLVRVTIREGSPEPEPFSPSRGSYEAFFDLENETGQWLIIGSPWPYYDWRC